MTIPRSIRRIAMRRALNAALSISLAGGLGSAAVLLTTPAAANASAINGTIARSETLSRSQYWVDQHVTYTQTGTWANDGYGKTYRRDCSGLVSMAWHLSNSYVTGDFQHAHDSTHPWTGVPGGLDGFQPGDAMVKSGHIELFVKWVNTANHGQGAYVYSFNSDGETVQNPYANSSFGNLGKNSWSDLQNYSPIRYDRITADATTTDIGLGTSIYSDGYLQVFATDARGVLRHLYMTNDGIWHETPPIATGVTGAPATTMYSDGNLQVFVKGTNGDLRHFYMTGDAVWHETPPIATGISSAPTATTYSDGNLQVFATGTSGQLRHFWMKPDATWIETPAIATGISGAPATTMYSDGNLQLFATGTSGQLRHFYMTNDAVWHETPTIATGLTSSPATTTYSDGKLQVFANGASGQLRHFWMKPDATWVETPAIATGATAAPATVTYTDGFLQVFTTDSTGRLRHLYMSSDAVWHETPALIDDLD
ncbi:hypothetical protein ACFO1B_45475 [Dactylosporangium siamense]|uniref:Bulb-type lectin domain-containing protein n=1 Tax=Dactylosporangium siamense TaxID=685454 RepID=A0A919UHA2_9ACTN|nr:hypothetical protein [Dactylosporangium siamense]GIG51415.1 hypothetical protein Dsi01nite_094560 [Dactylosporangium siamense]